jgi:hypothetical protein
LRTSSWISGSLALAVLLAGAGAANAAVHYVAPNGSNSGSGTVTSPWKTFDFAWDQLDPGDTLVLKDGDYFEDLTPPSSKQGTSTAPITIRAEHDWKAVVHGDNSSMWSPVLHLGSGNRYLVFDGLKIETNTDGSEGVRFSGGKNVTLRRMSIWCRYEPDDPWAAEGCIGMSGSSNDNLFEDSWIFDKARYTIIVYDGPTGNVFRRLVVRHGDYQRTQTENPQAGFVLYAASGNTIENMISLDNFLRSDSENSGFYLTAHPGQSASDNQILGLVTVNNHASPKRPSDDGGSSLPAKGIHLDCDTQDICANNHIENVVSWDNDSTGLNIHNSQGTTMTHLTLGQGDDGVGNNSSIVTLDSSLIYDNNDDAVNGSYLLEDYNNVFGNGSNSSSGLHDIHKDPGLLYMLRIEPGSAGSGKGKQLGSDMGANVVKRYQDGVLTNVDLWPWPNEQQIREDLCAPSGPFTNGWCATQKTLTQYLWEYRGNACPSEICLGGGPSAEVPSAPQGLTAGAASPTKINLTWVDTSDDEEGFWIERSLAANGPFVQVGSTGAGAESFSDTTLTAETTYFYRIAAFNDAGNSAYSNVASAITDPLPSDPQVSIVALPLSATQVAVCWSDVSTSENGYEIERSSESAPGEWELISTNPANSTCYLDKGLPPSTSLQYRVRAYSSLGPTKYSNIATATTYPAAPIPPSNLTALTLSSSQIELSWVDESVDELAFAIERADSSGVFQVVVSLTGGVRKYVDAGLTSSKDYTYRVRSYNPSGQAYSNYAGATTVNQSGTLLPPLLLFAMATDEGQVQVAWSNPSAIESGYQIERAPAVGVNLLPGDFVPISTTPRNIGEYVDSSLPASAVFYYRVRSYTPSGESLYSNMLPVTTLIERPLAPLGLGAIADGASVTLTWSDESNNEDGFVIERRSGWTGPYKTLTTVAPGTVSYEDSSLPVKGVWFYRVRAYNAAGGSPYTNDAGVTTLF